MVRRPLLVLAAQGLAGNAAAQTADWSRAGGEIFAVAAEPGAPADPASSASDPGATLPPPIQPYAGAIDQAAARHGLDPKLLHALVVVESAYRADACSSAGACGLTQLMPGTAVELRIEDRFDPVAALNGGADYLARQLRRFGDLRLSLAAYNAGPGRVERLGRIPRIPETLNYVDAVIDCYLALTAGRSIRRAADCRPAGGAR